MTTDVKKFLENELRNELVIASKRAGLSSIFLLVILEVPILNHFSNDFFNQLASLVLVLSLFLRMTLSKFKKMNDEKWHKLHLLTILLNSISWSAFLFHIAALAGGFYEIYILTYFVFAGLIASSAFTLSFSKRAFYAFASPIIASQALAFCLYTQDKILLASLLMMMTLFMLFLVKQRGRYEETWTDVRVKNFDLQNVVDTLPGGLLIVREGKYRIVNRYILNLFVPGYKLVNRSVARSIKYPEIGDLANQLNEFDKSGKAQAQFETDFVISGKVSTHLVDALRTGDGNDIIISTLDITERKMIDQERNQHKARLLNNAKMASLGEVASGLAHEINNPVAIISLKTQQLTMKIQEKKTNDQEIIAFLESIDTTALRLSDIVKRLRKFTQNSIGAPKSTNDLKDIVNEALSFCETKFNNHGIKISNEVAGDVQVTTIPSEIAQVILGALYNSFDAILHSNEKWIRLRSTVNNGFVNLIMTDSGKGIPKDIQDKIMDPFFSTKQVGQRVGLGLSFSQEIIKSHGGILKFNFGNVENTELIISLPIAQISRRNKGGSS